MFIYEHLIDFWMGWSTLEEFRQKWVGEGEPWQMDKREFWERFYYIVDLLQEHTFFDGVPRNLQGPLAGWYATGLVGPRGSGANYLWAFKQDNNGTTYIISEYPLHIEGAELVYEE